MCLRRKGKKRGQSVESLFLALTLFLALLTVCSSTVSENDSEASSTLAQLHYTCPLPAIRVEALRAAPRWPTCLIKRLILSRQYIVIDNISASNCLEQGTAFHHRKRKRVRQTGQRRQRQMKEGTSYTRMFK